MMQEATGRGKGGMIEKKRTTKHVVNPLLRFLQLAAACCVFPVILRSNTAGLRYNNFQAFIYLVAGTCPFLLLLHSFYSFVSFLLSGSVIAAFWALMMLLMDLVLCLSGRILHSVAYNVFVALGDFVSSFNSISPPFTPFFKSALFSIKLYFSWIRLLRVSCSQLVQRLWLWLC